MGSGTKEQYTFYTYMSYLHDKSNNVAPQLFALRNDFLHLISSHSFAVFIIVKPIDPVPFWDRCNLTKFWVFKYLLIRFHLIPVFSEFI